MGVASRVGTANTSEGTVNNFWKILTIIFLGAIFVAVLTHANGFATSAGTLFTGINGLAGTLEAGNIKAGS
jgi:hypothetical protein